MLVDVELPDGDMGSRSRVKSPRFRGTGGVVLTSIDGDMTTTEEARRAGARAFVQKADLPKAPLAQLLGGE